MVHEGMFTDLSSVPRIARGIVGRVGPHLEASIVHDWLYVAWQVEEIKPTDEMRQFADDVFRAGMQKAKVGALKRWAIYQAVRLGGRGTFCAAGSAPSASAPRPTPSAGTPAARRRAPRGSNTS